MKPNCGRLLLTSFILHLIFWGGQPTQVQAQGLNELRTLFEGLQKEMSELRKIVGGLGKQVQMQQFSMEERTRTDGNSGIKVVRGGNKGARDYDSYSHTGVAFASMHDHANYESTIGMGEVSVVMNGVEFRTRHNDYKLVMADPRSNEYQATVNIPYPEVPPEVSRLPNVADQVVEMREWFKAFQKQDRSERDYTKYFKPVLCYMEGAWITSKELMEPFQSDRHAIDAKSWDDLTEKIFFGTYSGTKPQFENHAFLPTTIVSVDEISGEPTYANWIYHILCHPIKRDIPLSFLQQVDDMAVRVSKNRTMKGVEETRAARFTLFDKENPRNQYQILDEIFREIPGKDNSPKNLSQDMFEEDMHMLDMKFPQESIPLDSSMYHRWFRSDKASAMGLQNVATGFNDDFLWVAQTTQEKVAPVHMTRCSKTKSGYRLKQEECKTVYNRFTYAFPLEIVYMTPLLSWNPYNLKFYEDKKRLDDDGKRKGGDTKQTAYNGIGSMHYYMTPAEFFSGSEDSYEPDPADTSSHSVGVLDSKGIVRKTSASGVRIVMPAFDGAGQIRLRYPIAPVHGEGSSVWKELNALRDKETGLKDAGYTAPSEVELELAMSEKTPPERHTHIVRVDFMAYTDMILHGREISVTSDVSEGHSHNITLSYVKSKKHVIYGMCDGERKCPDRHPVQLNLLTTNIFTEMP